MLLYVFNKNKRCMSKAQNIGLTTEGTDCKTAPASVYIKIYSTIILLLLSISCQMENNKEYTKYQTFDEYKLMGVGNTNIKEPYVLIKKELDTIFVIKSNDREKVVTYINKRDYWYSKTIIEVEAPPDNGELYKLDMTPTVCEKFIYNDIIVEYNYLLDDKLKRFGSDIYVHTKKDCIKLAIQDSDITNYDDPFNEIKAFVVNYKKIFPAYPYPAIYEPRYYTMLEKHVEGNVLTIYEIEEEKKRFVASKKMNSLGEFDNQGTMAWW